jgi:hypothetical protein
MAFGEMQSGKIMVGIWSHYPRGHRGRVSIPRPSFPTVRPSAASAWVMGTLMTQMRADFHRFGRDRSRYSALQELQRNTNNVFNIITTISYMH